MNSNVKTAVLWVVIICVAVLLWAVVHTGKTNREDQPTFTDLIHKVNEDKVASVVINASNGEVTGTYKEPDGRQFHSNIPANYPDVYKRLEDKGVNVDVKSARFEQLGFLPGEPPLHPAVRILDLHDAADAERRQQGPELRQEPRPSAFHRSRRR